MGRRMGRVGRRMGRVGRRMGRVGRRMGEEDGEEDGGGGWGRRMERSEHYLRWWINPLISSICVFCSLEGGAA